MIINILEDITTSLAASIIDKVGANTDEEIDVNIMSRGGDVMAGNAIIYALKLSPAKVTTKVFGVAASMAAAISQVGDVRLIAEDAIFQPHNSAALPNGRPTKENLQKAQEVLELVDGILLKSFSKSNLTDVELKALLIEDKPLSAQEAIKMAFFDGSIEPIKAAAHLNNLIMSKENTLANKLKAMVEAITPVKAEGEVTVAPPTDVEGEAVTREEFDALVQMVADLVEQLKPAEEEAPSMEDVVEAKLNSLLADIKSVETVPVASATGETPTKEDGEPEVSYLEARQKEIKSKFNQR